MREEQLLTTKLFIPKSRPGLVLRSRLIEQLNDGLHRKLVLISAPAGYGKTTLVTAWLHRLEGEEAALVCWLSLDEDDSDLQQFFSYLAAAVRSLPGIQSSLSHLLQTSQSFSSKTLMKAFVQDVTAVFSPFILVLDDYHILDSAEVDDGLSILLDFMPPQMTLVIASRSDPGFPISRLRARGELSELRADDLRFTEAEAAEFMQQTMHLVLQPDQITALENRTEGWIAGLQMAALSMQKRAVSGLKGFVESFTGSHRFIMDYLTDEVLAQVSPDVQAFLLTTSVLHHLCADLCDAVLPVQDSGRSQAVLEQLETSNIFLIPLDDERRWYRYHHLFADLLRQKLPTIDAQSARRKAAMWSAENGLTTESIEYALAAEAWDVVIPLLVKHGLAFVFQGKLTTLRRWFDTLPRDSLLQEPRMCLDYAWILVNQGEKDAVEPYLLAAETAAQGAPSTRAVTALIRANNARAWEDLVVMQAEARLSLQLIPPDHAIARCTALLQLGAAQILAEKADLEEAVNNLKEAIALARQSRNMNTAFLSGGYLGLAHLLRNDLPAAATALKEMQSFAAEQGLEQSPLLVYVHLGLAHLAFLNNEWDTACREIEQVQMQGRFANELSSLYRGNMLLALVEQALGDSAAAEAALVNAIETAAGLKNPDIPQQLQYLQNVYMQSEPSFYVVQAVRLLAAGASLSYARSVARPDAAQPEQFLIAPLSERELEILAHIAAGLKNKEIADTMVISLNTVLYHTKNIYNKLGVNKRTQAVLKAQDLNLL